MKKGKLDLKKKIKLREKLHFEAAKYYVTDISDLNYRIIFY